MVVVREIKRAVFTVSCLLAPKKETLGASGALLLTAITQGSKDFKVFLKNQKAMSRQQGSKWGGGIF